MQTGVRLASERHAGDGGTEEDVQSSKELLPESYRINSPKEKQSSEMADNFQRQYSSSHPDRKPSSLCPVNECGVRKFLPTTLRPTATGLCESSSWQDCSSFVADFSSSQPSEPPTVVPSQMFSPTSVSRRQKASCFESSTSLCSSSLGLSYDAYCVSGYASREMCSSDQSMQQCPSSDTEVESDISERKQQKYGPKGQRESRSRFSMEQEKKKEQAEAALLSEKESQEEKSRRLPDSSHGLRVHCWVSVSSGTRGVHEDFFIDPLTGSSFPTNDENFSGIESVWNTFNYYVNRSECINGCKDSSFDSEDCSRWEPVSNDAISQKELNRAVQRRRENRISGKMNSEADEFLPRKFISLRSWVSRIVVTQKDSKTRIPGGRKETHYRKSKSERFSPTLTKDGLVSRLTTYQDSDCTQVTRVKEGYKNRSDGSEGRDYNKSENITTEQFKSGRAFHLTFHSWKPVSSGTEREMRFSRPEQDGVERRVVSPQSMEEWFRCRDDFSCFRQVIFSRGGWSSTSSPWKSSSRDSNVSKVVERFDRNPSKPANEDVAQRVFSVPESQIELTYHLMDHRTIPSRRSFTKPEGDKPLTGDMFSSFQVDQSEKPPGPSSWYTMLQDSMKDEENSAAQITASSIEVKNISERREQEEKESVVFSSDSEEVFVYRANREEERMSQQDDQMLHQKEKELMVPFKAQLGNFESLSSEEASSFYSSYLDRFKEISEEHTDFSQRNSDTVIKTQTMNDKSEEHHHDPTMSKEEAELSCRVCWDKKFHIAVAQRRSDRHKDRMENKCQAFSQKLKQDFTK